MAVKNKHFFLSDQDKETIESCCRALRKSAKSRSNLFYIVSDFGEFMEGSVFDATQSNARNYIDHLKSECSNGRLKEKYCACIFSELRTFFDHASVNGLIPENPISWLENPFQFPDKLTAEDLPKLSDIDRLLTLCYDDSQLLVAVLLAFRMALPVSEIVGIEKKMFCLDEKEGNLYLKLWRWVDGDKKELFLYVPRDIVSHIRELCKMTPSDYPYLFRSKKTKKPYSVRSLQHKLDVLQANEDVRIHFSQLRSLCLYLMLVEKVPVDDICRFANIRGDWLSRYDEIPTSLIADASKYINIRII